MIAQHAPEWTIEPAVIEDAGLLAALHARSFRAVYRSSNPHRNHEVLLEASAFRAPDRVALRQEMIGDSLSENSGQFYYQATSPFFRPVGFIYGTKSTDGQELGALYVDPEYQRKHVGQKLVEAFVDWCDPTQPIELGVVKDNTRAQSFYRKMGFTVMVPFREPSFSFMDEITLIRPPEGDTL